MPSAELRTGVREMERSDMDIVLAWRNHPHIRRFMYSRHVIRADEHQRWFEQASADPTMHLLIFEREGEPSGFVSFSVVDVGARRAEWGFYVAVDAGKGSGGLLGEYSLSHAFKHLGLHKICGEALASNSRSIRLHQRLNFQQEARLRDHYFDKKGYQDVLCFGLIESEWNRSRRGV